MTKVITYGTYDLLHQGHINLLRRAKELGDYLIVGVTSDSFDRGRGKLNVRNNVLERVEAVKATGYADEVIIEDYVGQKIDDIQKYNIDIFAIGSDWEGKFDYLNEFTKVVYLPRTEGISSTMLRAETTTDVRVGIIGCGRVAKRFPSEADVVNGLKIVAAYDINQSEAEKLSSGIEDAIACNSVEELYDAVDAVKQISDKADNTYPKKCMCVIFTDAVNDNLGGTTDDEVLKAARATGVPVYAVAINPNDKASIDSLGEISRASGGELCVATGGNIAKAFDKALAELSTLYEITFTTKTNKTVIGENNISICIGDKSEGNVAERKFQSTSWAVDNEAPYIASYKLVSDKELLLKFNEPVENAGKVENYTVKKGGSTYKIKDARYDESTNTVLLSFSEYLSNGTYKIKTSNITDSSMEENALSSTYKFKRSGFAGFFAGVKNFLFTNYGWIIVLVVILVLAFVTHKIIKKRKGIVMLDNKATFGDNISYEHTAPKALPSHYLKLTMETADGAITNMDINIVQSIIFGRADSCEVTIDDANLSSILQ